MKSNSLAFPPAWWLVFWGLLTSLSMNWVLPVFDHHAAEYSPFHGHAVAGGAAQLHHLLEIHAHGAGQPHTHSEAGAPVSTTSGTVISLSALDGLLTLVARAADVVVTTAWPLPQPPVGLWLAVGMATVLLLWRATPPPKSPPRPL